MSIEKKPLITIEDIKERIAEIDSVLKDIADKEYRDGFLTDRMTVAQLRDEKLTLQDVLEVVGGYSLADIQRELDIREPDERFPGQYGLDRYSYYVLAHAEVILEAQDKNLSVRVDLGEYAIELWEREFGHISEAEDKAVYALIRDKSVPLADLEENIRKCLIRGRENLYGDLVDIGGIRCLKVAEWQDGVDSYVLGNAVNNGEFYYAEVNGSICNTFEYDFRPSREKVEEDWLNLEAERAINRQEELAGGFDMEKELHKGNPEFYKMFYSGAGQQDAEAYAFQKETGWHMIWGSDYQGLNGDTWVVYRDVSDLPSWLREYAREEEKIEGHDEQQKSGGNFIADGKQMVGVEVLFTFGTAKFFPFELGYVSITAPSVKMAIEEFRRNYPDYHEGLLNCADYYYTPEAVARIKEHGNGGRGCHRAIIISSRDKDVDELLANAKSKAAHEAVTGNELKLDREEML